MGGFSGLDIAIVAVLLVSAIISVMRGFVREALSLLAWFVSVWVAIAFARPMSLFLEPHIDAPAVRVAVAFAVLFFSSLLLLTLVATLVSQLVKRSQLSGFDRIVGLVFGLVRGGVIVAVFVLLAGMSPLATQTWWRDSTLVGHFQTLAGMMRHNLPAEFAASN